MFGAARLDQLHRLVRHWFGKIAREDLVTVKQTLPQQVGIEDIERCCKRIKAVL